MNLGETPVIPISLEKKIDSLEDDIILKLKKACETSGYFAVRMDKNDISPEVISKMYVSSNSFFMLPLEAKKKINARCHIDRCGWMRLAKDDTIKSCCSIKAQRGESFSINSVNFESFINDTKSENENMEWPEDLPEFRISLIEFYEYSSRLSNYLMEAFALMLKLPNTTFTEYTSPFINSPLRITKYSSRDSSLESKNNCHHKSCFCLSFLHQDTKGLEIKHLNGEWIQLPVKNDQLIVLLGDIMERWTNGNITATIYRDLDVPYRRQIIERHIGIDRSLIIQPFKDMITTNNPRKYLPISGKDQISYHRIRPSKVIVHGFHSFVTKFKRNQKEKEY